MKKTAAVLGVILVVLLIAFFSLNNYIYNAKQADLSMYSIGSYAYQCADGSTFTMSPAADMSSIYIAPAEGRVPETILSKVEGTNARYEGNGVVFAGNGETVVIVMGDFQTDCTPLPSTENAPFNFGDAEQNASNEAWTPDRITLEGEYVCLPHADTEGPQTMECAFGIRTDTAYYALDFALMSQESPQLMTGDRFRASGIFTPVEALSSSHWWKYDIQGIFSVTDSVEKI